MSARAALSRPAFKAWHGIENMVVVADAGMLSAANLTMLKEFGHRSIVGSRVTKAPIDLQSHFRWHGDAFTDGQVIDTLTPKSGKNAENDPAVKVEPVWAPRRTRHRGGRSGPTRPSARPGTIRP